MSVLARAAETFLPLTVACEQAGYPTNAAGQRNLRRQMRRKGFAVLRLGNAYSVQVGVWTAYLDRCRRDAAAHQATMAEYATARWAARHEAGARTWKSVKEAAPCPK